MTAKKAMTKEDMEKFVNGQKEIGLQIVRKLDKDGDLPPTLDMLVDDTPVEAVLALILATYQKFKEASEEMGVEFSAEELVGRMTIKYALERLGKLASKNGGEETEEKYVPAKTGPLPGYM